jgi:putative CocE/NonD family hydrolase
MGIPTFRISLHGLGRPAACALVALALLAPAAAGAKSWTPEPATYGTSEQSNVPVTMSDGTVLRADVYWPADTKTAKPATGHFPVVLTQTPYGKNSGLGSVGNQLTGAFPYLVERGYIDVVADVRGTGDSHGTWDIFDPVQIQDGVQLVRWASRLAHADGRVGLYGESYLGINQLMTASAVGRQSPLKAIFPVVAGNDLYRDIAYYGGVSGLEFDGVFLGLTGGLNAFNPFAEAAQSQTPDPSDTAGVETEHTGGLISYHAATLLSAELQGPESYDEAYWQQRNPRNLLARIVANGIPAFLVGGWFDLFQRGEPLNYSGLQDAFAHRSVGAPMSARQKLTGRYQLLMGPWYHVTAPAGIDLQSIELQWFDHWLKGRNTGITNTNTPLHAYELGANRYVEASRYPFPAATPSRYYLSAGNALSQASPTSSGADTVVFTGATSPCDRQTEQWGAGGGALATEEVGQPAPCTTDDRTLQLGPGALTYTTAPFTSDTVLAGPSDATIYASSTRPETFFEATLEDIAPDGTSTPLTGGGLLGSFRARDTSRSWLAPDGSPLLPYHPYTQASVQAVPDGAVVRYDVEVFPTFALLAKGHSLRVTITTSDTPHLGFTPAQLSGLLGGVYQVQRSARASSYMELPLAPASAFSRPCRICRTTG